MSWKETILGEVITLQRGFDLPSQNRINGEIPVVSSSGISGFHNIAKVTGPGVVTGRYGTLGEVFFIEGDFWPLNTSLFVVDFKENHRRFIAYFLQNLLKNITSDKAAVPGINRKDLHAKKVLFPEYYTQQRIADILSKYDDLIENNRRRIQLLEEAARLLYQEWFIRLRFPGHEHTKIVDGVPEGWRKKTLGETTVLNYGKALKEENRIPGPIPVYGSSGIVGYHEKPLVEGPGIIIGRKGNVGSVFWADSDFHPIDTVYYVNKEETSFFLYYALSNISFVNTDVAVPGLNRTYAYSRTIMWPNATIMEIFDSFITPIHTQISLLNKNIDSVVKARNLLLSRLMNGVIPV